MPPPPYQSEAAQYAGAGRVMQTEPSQDSAKLASDHYESGEEDEVIVIHEHHHHHHHQDEQINNGTNAPSNLLDSILNDDVLYDFVSFLIEEAQFNNNAERDGEDSDSSWTGYSESYRSHPESRELLEEQVRIVSSYESSQFLKDGFTPIVEVELDK